MEVMATNAASVVTEMDWMLDDGEEKLAWRRVTTDSIPKGQETRFSSFSTLLRL